MRFAKDLVGGMGIMVFALLVGILQNSVRSKPMQLVPRVPANLSEANVPEPAAEEPVERVEADSTRPVSQSPDLTADERGSGEVLRDRVKILMDAGNTIIIDARGEDEFAQGHIPGALNIPYENFFDYQDLLDGLPTDMPIICYCRSLTCDLSDQLAQELQLMGYETVVLYRGGWQEWEEAGYPAETDGSQ